MTDVSKSVDRSYQLLALLEACAHSANYISDGIGEGREKAAAGELAVVLQLACEIAGEVHDGIEKGPALKVVAS